jgi:hypothetical protein
MKAKHIACEQGSPEWFKHRRGIPTASEFGRILTPKRLHLSESADRYIEELIAERLCEQLPEGVENFTSRSMRFGIETEDEARSYFKLRTGFDAVKCGFCVTEDGTIGCSPDALVYDGDTLIGGLELKCPEAKTHIRWLLGKSLPEEHKPQVHGGMIVTGLDRWWFMSYRPDLKNQNVEKGFILSVKPDVYTDMLIQALGEFNTRLSKMATTLGAISQPPS